MASEIRANKQTNRVGLGTVTYTDTGIIVSGIVTANSFKGDGSSLTGIDATALKDTGGNVKIQAQASGAIHSGISTFNEIKLGDNKKILLGTGSDLEIYHTGSGAAILNSDTSTQLTIASDNALNLTSRTGTEYYFRAYPNNRAELYYDYSTHNTPKLQTSATGVTVDGTVAATSYTGDGSSLTGIEVGLSTASAQVSGITTVIDLSKDDIRLDCTGLVTVDAKGGTEGGSHSLRIVNSGIATVTFNSYFKFPSGGAPNLPTASGAISLISFTVHTQGRVGVASVFLAGSSVNFS